MECIEVSWHVFPKLLLCKLHTCNFIWQVHIQVFSRANRLYEVLILLSQEEYKTHKENCYIPHCRLWTLIIFNFYLWNLWQKKKLIWSSYQYVLPQLWVNVYCSIRANYCVSGCKHLFVALQQKARHLCEHSGVRNLW